jgi:hypothetical protein
MVHDVSALRRSGAARLDGVAGWASHRRMGRLTRLCLLATLWVACTPTEFVGVRPDVATRMDDATPDVAAPEDRPGVDVITSPDAQPRDAGVADVVVPSDAPAGSPCTEDRQCSGGVCDLGRQRCVECLQSSQCDPGETCLGARCVNAPSCTTSRTCPGQVCSDTLRVCVDCETNADCGARVCVRNVCVDPPRACTSDRECSALGQVCDLTRRVCVECADDGDCTAGQHCGDAQLCLTDLCAANATRCADLATQITCDARGVRETPSPCPSGQTCRTTRCEPTVCTPGSTRCSPTGALETCTPDGGGYSAAACGAQQSCSAGRCVTWMCTPGARACDGLTRVNVCDPNGLTATPTPCRAGESCRMGQCMTHACTPNASSCADTSNRRVCDADGLGSTLVPCPLPSNASAATCASGACGFVCAAGFGDCDGNASDGCEVAVTNNPQHCGACGRPCAARANATATCANSTCEYRCAEGFADCDGNASNGCEVNLLTSAANCGRCGNACAVANRCDNGACALILCAGGLTSCGGSCVDLRNANAHCGACGRACASSTACRAGNCERVFRIASLATTNARVVDHNATTSDDRGGIASSDTEVYYGGDRATGAFSAEDLSGARIAAMPPVDGLFSNLRTGVLYALSTNGLSAFQFIVGPSGPSFTSATFTHILELDRDRLTPTGVIITLSRSVTMTGGATIYAGYDRIVLASNAGSFDVALPGAPASPGSVTDLGVSVPPRRGCENWAAWGIAEFYGGAIWLARASSTSADIVRTRVPDGLTETVARFSNVGDLCGFTVVPSRGRWYFHHEGNSQFAMGLAEVIGYADATFVFSD